MFFSDFSGKKIIVGKRTYPGILNIPGGGQGAASKRLPHVPCWSGKHLSRVVAKIFDNSYITEPANQSRALSAGTGLLAESRTDADLSIAVESGSV